MITEIAKLTIDPATAQAFEAAMADYANQFADVPGASTMTLERVIEEKGVYFMRMLWESIEQHRAGSDSASAQYWGEKIRPFYVAPPQVVHADTVHLRS